MDFSRGVEAYMHHCHSRQLRPKTIHAVNYLAKRLRVDGVALLGVLQQRQNMARDEKGRLVKVHEAACSSAGDGLTRVV